MEDYRNFTSPIITSFLDQDFYTFTQGQLAFHRHADVPVKFALFNRTTGIPLADLIDQNELERELERFAILKPTAKELSYLSCLMRSDGQSVFATDYLEFLQKMTPTEYSLTHRDGQFQFETSGPWSRAIYWEVPTLRIILRLYTKKLLSKMGGFDQELAFAHGNVNLENKIKMIRDNPEVTFSDFGTRRAFSPEWHGHVVTMMKQEVDPRQFVGTSNVYLAMKYGLKPIGTNSHQAWQIYSGIYESETVEQLASSQTMFLKDWWDEHGHDLSIGLTDTFGTDFFLKYVFTPEWAKKYRGLRQDSGRPVRWAEEKIIPFYKNLDIDPMEKISVLSDGLMTQDMPIIYHALKGKLWITYGWGTNLTNHLLPIIRPPSLVIKAVEALGRPLVKLSDNPLKAIGNPVEVKRIMEMTECSTQESIAVKY